MLCSGCKSSESIEKELNIGDTGIQGKVWRIECNKCWTFVGLKHDDKIIDVSSVCQDQSVNGWKEARTNREKLVYYILCQIVYPEFDAPVPERLESPFDFADESDLIVIRWMNGKPIGFYTVKPKGTEIFITKDVYEMSVLDTAYIRSEFRSKGFGVEMIHDMIKRFPDQDIGFSQPISHGMLKVLKNFLSKNKEFRLRFWTIADWDLSGSQQLIWFRVKNL